MSTDLRRRPKTLESLSLDFNGFFASVRSCQTNANPSPIFADGQVLGDEKVAPLAKGGVAFLFGSNPGADVPFEVEVIVH